MIRLCYATQPDQLEINGDASDFEELAGMLLQAGRYTIDVAFDPAPYDRTIRTIEVVRAEREKVSMIVEGESLKFVGNEQNLQWLSDEIKDFGIEAPVRATSGMPYHQHLEPYDGHPVLAMDSVNAILSKA